MVISVTCVACSDDGADPSDEGDGGSGGSSGSDHWWCSCVDGPSVQVDSPDEDECAATCDELGGFLSIEPVVSAVGTPECDAFCAKADALACGGNSCKSQQDFWCTASPGECIEALEAQLQCKTEMGEFTCDGNSWQMSAPCGTFDELCADR